MLTLNFNPFPILTSERLRLRRLTDSDVNAVFELRSNPKTMKYIPRPLATTTDEALLHIKTINYNIDANTDINWAVTEKDNDKCIGIMGFFRTQPENYRTELGYMILPEHHNKGYVTEAVKTILNYAFNELDFNSIKATIDPENIASEKVLQKNGFIKEGHLIENFFYNGQFIDSVIYSLLKRNFKKIQ
ncbi:GNAT family N-acetyltransferase [uncultured Flavobacterium sp.]|uniref:GNAT family N-acetyltransferase n=1 Tax=uncultured Flavobacterium sp. TaxID=165435 RepID=UPI0030EBE565